MAVRISDLFDPKGPLEEEFFPEVGDTSAGEDPLSDALAERIQGYIAKALLKVAAYPGSLLDTDAAVRAWALHLAFHALWLLSVNRPASAMLEGLGSAGYAKDQRDAFKEQAAHWAGVYEEYAPEVPLTDVGVAARSHAVPTRFTW